MLRIVAADCQRNFLSLVAYIALVLTCVVVPGSSITVPCDIRSDLNPRFWLINDSVYDAANISKHFPSISSSFSSLNITGFLYNATFKCGAFTKNGDIIWGSKFEHVINDAVSKTLLTRSRRIRSTELSANSVDIDYQVTRIVADKVIVGFKYNRETVCSNVFQLQGSSVTANTVPVISNRVEVNGSNIASLSLDQLGNDNNRIYYRLVALRAENDTTICSDSNSQETFYQFNETVNRVIRVAAPNSTECFDLPQTSCFSQNVVLTQIDGSVILCPVFNSTRGTASFMNCGGLDDVHPTPTIPRNGVLCFDATANLTTFHFVCTEHRPCMLTEFCVLNTFLSSHRIVIASPPSEPVITYNDTSLCFSAFSHVEFPVHNFTVELTDITGVSTSLDGTYDASGNVVCLGVLSGSVPNVCLPLSASVTATNAIGMNSSQINLGEVDCDCYHRRDPVNVTVSNLSATSADIRLDCGTNATVHLLQSDGEFEMFVLRCGENSIFDNLTMNTEYAVIREHPRQINCTLATFVTVTPSATTVASATVSSTTTPTATAMNAATAVTVMNAETTSASSQSTTPVASAVWTTILVAFGYIVKMA